MQKILKTIDILIDEDKKEIFQNSKKPLPIAITEEHKILTINGWKEVRNLKLNDYLVY